MFVYNAAYNSYSIHIKFNSYLIPIEFVFNWNAWQDVIPPPFPYLAGRADGVCVQCSAHRSGTLWQGAGHSPVDPSSRALSGRRKLTTRRHKFNTDSFSSALYRCRAETANMVHM